eukprot:12813874-Alexandrium_andersonii.AAC.2
MRPWDRQPRAGRFGQQRRVRGRRHCARPEGVFGKVGVAHQRELAALPPSVAPIANKIAIVIARVFVQLAAGLCI